jgi:TetR/AcrR family transcriptional regulator, copper-responsive repressor
MDDLKADGLLDIASGETCFGMARDEAACGAKRSRGRPRTYNPDEVLETALELFWSKGFAATSLDDLSEATGVSRPSLASGFGDKEAIYVKAMERYRNQINEQLDLVLTCQGPDTGISDVILRYFDVMISSYTGEIENLLGCAFMCTALNETPQHESILCLLQETIAEFDRRFEAFFTKAQQIGLVAAGVDPKVLSQMILGLTNNIGVRARAGASRAELETIVRDTTRFLFA